MTDTGIAALVERLRGNDGLWEAAAEAADALEACQAERDDARAYGGQARIRENKAEDERIHWKDRAEKAEAEIERLRAADMFDMLDEVRNAALEEAAKVADEHATIESIAQRIAVAIRALKDGEP